MADSADKPLTDWYAQLDLRPDASTAEINAAYRRLARALHPDSARPQAVDVERLQRAVEAHDILSNPARRRDYDQRRSLRHDKPRSQTLTRCPVCRGARLIASPCGQCRATGYEALRSSWLHATRPCRICRATGERMTPCGACGMTGYVTTRPH